MPTTNLKKPSVANGRSCNNKVGVVNLSDILPRHKPTKIFQMKQKTLFIYNFCAAALLSAISLVNSDGVEQRQISDCIHFDTSTFSKDNASIVVLQARGRLGNHLMAYTVLNSLRDEFKARAYIFEDTFDLVSKYFRVSLTLTSILIDDNYY